MHGQSLPHREPSADPCAARIADLSDEYLRASQDRREEIGNEIAALMAGRVVPMTRPV